ncbi:putative zinc-binding metallopeptidase [uncultured Sphaerotilus sp.]|uniref:zinc-binding metallopeptidase family protein n=1 Tax=uncultured Sphaerotilus sp. TaxID=474984 RepID=UPI0030CA3F4E
MDAFLTQLGRHLADRWRAQRQPRTLRAFRCLCGAPVFFRNSGCLSCGRALGYDPAQRLLLALDARGEALVEARPASSLHLRAARVLHRCANAVSAASCNWLVPDGERNGAGERPLFCVACRLNRVIPDQTVAHNQRDWALIEQAKRRLVSQLLALGLPVQSRLAGAGGEDMQRGLAFDFLRPVGGQGVLTGHASGVITLNVDEADDPTRERIRASLREPYRTLLGHFRHEVGHYYWDRLVAGTGWLPAFRQTFGDERADYRAALERNYRLGPPPDWANWHVSAYASCHPWEDWAETWAHYLHMVDALDTGLSFGLDADDVEVDVQPFDEAVLTQPDAEFLRLVNAWVELTALLNELSRSMGEPDFYPFVLSQTVVRKLHLVHQVVTRSA